MQTSTLCPCGRPTRVERLVRACRITCSASGCWRGPERPTEVEALAAWRQAFRWVQQAQRARARPLTPRQEDVLEFIRSSTLGSGRRAGMTLAEIARHFRLGISTTQQHVAALREAGLLVPKATGAQADIFPQPQEIA